MKINNDINKKDNKDFNEIYKEDAKLYMDIVRSFEKLTEYDYKTAYNIMIRSLQLYNRWSKIKYDIKKDSGRGENVAIKERIYDMIKYLKEVHITSRSIWKTAQNDERYNSEN